MTRLLVMALILLVVLAAGAAGREIQMDLNLGWGLGVFSPAPTLPKADQVILAFEEGPGETKLNKCAFGTPMRLGDKTYEHGIGVNSYSVLRIELGRPAARFFADIGLDRNVDDTTPASVRFRVKVAGEEVFATEVMRPKDGWRHIEIPLEGAKQFELIVDDGGDGRGWDQGDWADAKILFKDGSEAWLDELAQVSQAVATFPFSFVYGGVSSAELLPRWDCKVEEEQLPHALKRILVFSDPETGLEVRAEATLYTDTPGSDWMLRFTNKSAKPLPILEQVRALDFQVKPGMAPPAEQVLIEGLMGGPQSGPQASEQLMPKLRGLEGSTGCVEFTLDDFQPWEETLASGKRFEFGVAGMQSSLDKSPFFTLSWPGGGAAFGLGWTGAWQAEAERGEDGVLRIAAGMKRFRASLAPGESFRSPRMLQVMWQGLPYAKGCNLFRRAMLAHIVQRVDGQLVLPPIAHTTSSFAEINATTEVIEKQYLASIKGLGFDTYWLDAWWLRGGFPAGMGSYGLPAERMPDPERFPNGVKPVMDYARGLGLECLAWFAPETVMPGTLITAEHPEFMLSLDDGVSGTYAINQPEARGYLTDVMDDAIKTWGLNWWRTDSGPGPQVWALDEGTPDHQGLSETAYVEGLYTFWDELLARNPGLALDNCCGGGTRIDLETCARMTSLWRTDGAVWTISWRDANLAALQAQLITAQLNWFVPFSQQGVTRPEPYYLRSGFNGGLTFWDDTRIKGYPRQLLKQGLTEIKRMQTYVTGDFYPLFVRSQDASEWCVYQWNRPEAGDGMLLAFRRHESPYEALTVHLQGLDEKATYEVTFSPTYKQGKPVRMRGKELAKLRLEITEQPGSLLVEYTKIKN